MSRRALQLVNVLLGVTTVALGLMTLLWGAESPIYAAAAGPRCR